jgi:hypothetical protein
MSCSSANKKSSKNTQTSAAVTEVQKPVGPVRAGQYYPATGVFVYKKNRLILKDKEISYNLVDNTGLLENIVQKVTDKFDIQSYEYVNLEIQGDIKEGTIYINRIVNYRAPEDRYQADVIID